MGVFGLYHGIGYFLNRPIANGDAFYNAAFITGQLHVYLLRLLLVGQPVRRTETNEIGFL